MQRRDTEFSVLLRRVLERARKALEVLAGSSVDVDSGIDKLQVLCNGNEKVVSSLAGVMRALGKHSVAARVFMSVMDDDEKSELEALSREAVKRAKNGRRALGEPDNRISAFVNELRQIGVPKRLLSDIQERTMRFFASELREAEPDRRPVNKERKATNRNCNVRTTEADSAQLKRNKKNKKSDRVELERPEDGPKKPKVVRESDVALQRRLQEAEEEFEEVRDIMTNPGPVFWVMMRRFKM
jgi:hypothetical protein